MKFKVLLLHMAESEYEISNVCWLVPPPRKCHSYIPSLLGVPPVVPVGLYFALTTIYCSHDTMFPEHTMPWPSSTELASGDPSCQWNRKCSPVTEGAQATLPVGLNRFSYNSSPVSHIDAPLVSYDMIKLLFTSMGLIRIAAHGLSVSEIG